MHSAHNSKCPNCGYVYPGSYCPECGLERHAAIAQVRAANRRALKGVIMANLACLPSVPYLIYMATLLPRNGEVLIAILLYYPPFIMLLAASFFIYKTMVWANVRSRHAFHLLMIAIVTGWFLYLFVISDGEFISDLQREVRWVVENLRKSF